MPLTVQFASWLFSDAFRCTITLTIASQPEIGFSTATVIALASLLKSISAYPKINPA
jgi:hypothetical protein